MADVGGESARHALSAGARACRTGSTSHGEAFPGTSTHRRGRWACTRLGLGRSGTTPSGRSAARSDQGPRLWSTPGSEKWRAGERPRGGPRSSTKPERSPHGVPPQIANANGAGGNRTVRRDSRFGPAFLDASAHRRPTRGWGLRDAMHPFIELVVTGRGDRAALRSHNTEVRLNQPTSHNIRRVCSMGFAPRKRSAPSDVPFRAFTFPCSR